MIGGGEIIGRGCQSGQAPGVQKRNPQLRKWGGKTFAVVSFHHSRRLSHKKQNIVGGFSGGSTRFSSAFLQNAS